MPLSPEAVAEKRFSGARGWGYERGAVEAFLSCIAADYRVSMERVDAMCAVDSYEKTGVEIAWLLRSAGLEAAELVRSAKEEAERTHRHAARKTGTILGAGDRKIAKTVSNAKQWCKDVLTEAEHESTALLIGVEREAREVLDEVARKQMRIRSLEQQVVECLDLVEDVVVDLMKEQELSGNGYGKDDISSERLNGVMTYGRSLGWEEDLHYGASAG